MIEITMALLVESYNMLPHPRDHEDGQVMVVPLMDANGNEIQIRFIKENDYEWTPFKDIVVKGYINRLDKVQAKQPFLSFFKQKL